MPAPTDPAPEWQGTDCPKCHSSNTDVVPLAGDYVRECQNCGYIDGETEATP